MGRPPSENLRLRMPKARAASGLALPVLVMHVTSRVSLPAHNPSRSGYQLSPRTGALVLNISKPVSTDQPHTVRGEGRLFQRGLSVKGRFPLRDKIYAQQINCPSARSAGGATTALHLLMCGEHVQVIVSASKDGMRSVSTTKTAAVQRTFSAISLRLLSKWRGLEARRGRSKQEIIWFPHPRNLPAPSAAVPAHAAEQRALFDLYTTKTA
jgi:hypothetical protein